MKIRFTHNSIRFRLRKSDIRLLAEEESIIETVTFLNGESLTFMIVISDLTEEVKPTLNHHIISIALPKKLAHQWINTEQVGIEFFQDIPEHQQLHILIEKDFPCAHRPHEDKSDTFQELVD